jgi:hypothetical protein
MRSKVEVLPNATGQQFQSSPSEQSKFFDRRDGLLNLFSRQRPVLVVNAHEFALNQIERLY